MLVSSRRIELLERYRVPYVVEPSSAPDGMIRIARADQAAPELLFVESSTATPAFWSVSGIRMYVAIRGEQLGGQALQPAREWRDEIAIEEVDGTRRSSIRRAGDGSLFLPFDLDAPFEALLHEAYAAQGASGRLGATARALYYRARPLIPRPLQLALRRGFRGVQERAEFPAWPTETAFHALEALILGLIEDLAGEPLPWLSPWPEPYEWALVLTHDVEREPGYRHILSVRATEERHGVRSAWYFVPERDYRVDDEMLESLRKSGCEICLHGLRHDGRDLDPAVFRRRLPSMRSYLEAWGAIGFRSPATHRDRDLLARLGVDHDSSWSDVARYEPQPGGTGCWLPFFIGEVVELPITLPMDHTLFEIRGEVSEQRWVDKSALLRRRGGMGVLLTHPDYLLEPERLAVYDRFLAGQVTDSGAWLALPSEVSSWWRRRHLSEIVREGGSWAVRGPASGEARVRLGAPTAFTTETLVDSAGSGA